VIHLFWRKTQIHHESVGIQTFGCMMLLMMMSHEEEEEAILCLFTIVQFENK
jgi:hypothetical protein